MAAYDEDAIIVGASSILLGYAYRKLLVEENKRERKKRPVWVKECLAERGAKGAYNALVKQLMLTFNVEEARLLTPAEINHVIFPYMRWSFLFPFRSLFRAGFAIRFRTRGRG